MSGKCSFSTTVNVSFSEDVLGVVSTKVPILILDREVGFYILRCSNLSSLGLKKMMKSK